MTDRGSIEIADLAVTVARAETVAVRLAVSREADQWQLRRGEVIIDAPAPLISRRWAYHQDVFLEEQVPATLASALLGGQPQEVAGFKVTVPEPAASNANWERIAGQRRTGRLITPWPRTEWQVSGRQLPSRQDGLFIGDGPSFLGYAAASSAFFDAAPPDHQDHGRLWRVIRHERRAWLHRIKIGPLSVVVDVRGSDLSGARLELTTPTTSVSRPVGATGRVTFRTPAGLAAHTLLVLRTDDDWLDFRYFDTLIPGGTRDTSIEFDQPGTDLELLISSGEGQYIEFKRILTAQDDKRSFLKTVAAFASYNSGTIVIGVDDDGTIVGVPSAERDALQRQVVSVIRDNIEPEPQYQLRWVEHEHKHVLLLEVEGRPQWFVLYPKKPEFYVRRAGSTWRAKREDIAAGFGAPSV
ncbi:AlbA family DNA-binding domain-containing protein [Allorhizocola rhizosphaerae]|uniref:AlbA family DNA-binding domain-containing protein n=1 Tax=Allorhizocola rhizosphaerae TaxID=1872709 RepID=UPI0013C2E061|nr:ATP-binding protein [Allorhizocola rhizosphaerae]